MPRMLSRISLFIILAAALLVPHFALAHAVLVTSSPRDSETVQGSSMRIDLKFNSRVDSTRSTLSLASPDGNLRTLSIEAQQTSDELISHVDGLSKGSYTLRWQALASDGHITRGQIAFKVE